MQKADVLDIRVPEYLMGLVDLKEQRGSVERCLASGDKAKIREVVELDKPLIYHHGGGFVEDHVRFEQCGKQIDDNGMRVFFQNGFHEDLAALELPFASFGLCGTSLVTNVKISDDGLRGKWVLDPSEELKIKTQNKWFERFQRNLETVRSKYKGFLGFENVPWKADYKKDPQVKVNIFDPAFIKRFYYKRFPDLFFHLDIAHAKVSAWNLYPEHRTTSVETAKWYMKQLPLDRVKAVHISGTVKSEGWMYEPHTAPQEDDYDLLSWLLPKMPLLEYVESEDYKSSEAILAGQIAELKRIVQP